MKSLHRILFPAILFLGLSLSAHAGARDSLLNQLQAYGDACSDQTFETYLSSDETIARQMEVQYPILQYYRSSFEKVLSEVQTEKVKKGSVVIWNLYNMGYIVKTPSVCFGIDLNHKYAVKFAPYIDFLCITHKHDDHVDTLLNRAMYRAGKAVVSNFYQPEQNYPFLVKEVKDLEIKGIKIRTNSNDHNSKLRDFVLTYQFNCGKDTRNVVLMHVGDSSFNPKQYDVKEDVDVLIPRYAPTIDRKIIGPVIQPKVVLMSHIMELRHVNKVGSRSSLRQGLEHNAELENVKAMLLFWGEKFVYTKE